jgi:hypothetical protein
METIKIRFQRTAGGRLTERFVRGCIRLKTGDSLTHCCVLLPDGGLIDATHRYGVARRADSDGLLASQIVETDIPVSEFMKWVEPRLGMPFDFMGMICHLLSCRIKVLGAYYCSSLISEFLAYHLKSVEREALCSRGLRDQVIQLFQERSKIGEYKPH